MLDRVTSAADRFIDPSVEGVERARLRFLAGAILAVASPGAVLVWIGALMGAGLIFKKQFAELEAGVNQLLVKVEKSYEAFREMEMPGIPPPVPHGAFSEFPPLESGFSSPPPPPPQSFSAPPPFPPPITFHEQDNLPPACSA